MQSPPKKCYYISVMAQVRPELKARLVGEGKWGDFVRFRSELVGRGAKPASALREAVAKFCPDFEGDGVKPDGPKLRAEQKAGVRPKRMRDEYAAAAKKIAEEVSSGKVAAVGGGEFVDAEAFRGKAFSSKDAPQMVAWVMERIFVKDVKPEDAPSGMAWTLLLMCRRSAAFAEDFVSKSVVKMIPSKPPDEERGGDDDFDGKLEYDILGRLLDGEGR